MGLLDRHKARLVAKDFHQHYGVDYSKTFSPVIKITTIRIVLDVAASKSWSIRQLDVNNAFLQGTLTEEVYMTQPPGLIDQTHPDYVCRLNKPIYELVTNVETSLATRFFIKDPCDLHYFLGIEVTHTTTGLHLMQRKYIIDLLTKTHMLEAKPISTPLPTSPKLTLNSGRVLENAKQYRMVVGSLQYLPSLVRILPMQSAGYLSTCTNRLMIIGRLLRESFDIWQAPSHMAFTFEVRWICSLLSELGLTLRQPPAVYCDNVGANYLCANPVFHSRMKHIALDYHFVHEQVQSGMFRVSHVSTHDQLADMLTKPLPRSHFQLSRNKLGVIPMPPS
ncbi:unnamed protein product [Microthlaspi erraticum]|uniref:Reverse transcriptase Ty1/copia-type domain-containing protein n=1 Tax=Microthlaspi erraticum TaxID=1685480 RepID=A0A6D2HJB7_9BRAS|nr:unnamed protein product [Microthlaspi erraticum]